MSLSNEWFDYHLTPRGWEEGSCKIDFGGITEKDPPQDRVLTVHISEKQSSIYSEMQRSSKVTFRTEDTQALNDLIEKFGEEP